jgi:hypothetical protein
MVRPVSTLTGGESPRSEPVPFTSHLGAWIVAAIALVVASMAPAPFPRVARYSLVAVALYLLLAGADRWANPINRFARNLGG